MKKASYTLIAVSLPIILMLSLTGCSGTNKNDSTQQITNQKVGIIVPESYAFSFLDNLTITRWTTIEKGVRNALEERIDSKNIITKTTKTISDETDAINSLMQEDNMTTLFMSPLTVYSKDKDKEENNSQASQKLLHSLNAAHEKGVYIAGWGDHIPGFSYDSRVELPTPREIGTRQAEYIVDTLGINDTKSTKKNIEVFISDENEKNSKQYFEGIWDYLQPYFKSNKLYNPSGKLNKDTTQSSLSKLKVNPSDTDQNTQAFEDTLKNVYKIGTSSPVALDAVLATDDSIANSCSDALSDLGVDPDAQNSKFPVITGFGGFKSGATNITNKKQSMTMIYDVNSLVQQIVDKMVEHMLTKINSSSNKGGGVTGEGGGAGSASASASSGEAGSTGGASAGSGDVDASREGTEEGAGVSDTYTIKAHLEVVTQSNMMKLMIKPGYITPADAGI
jgi:hypothetical protein